MSEGQQYEAQPWRRILSGDTHIQSLMFFETIKLNAVMAGHDKENASE